jgi:hypothetical protein
MLDFLLDIKKFANLFLVQCLCYSVTSKVCVLLLPIFGGAKMQTLELVLYACRKPGHIAKNCSASLRKREIKLIEKLLRVGRAQTAQSKLHYLFSTVFSYPWMYINNTT